MVIIFGQSVVNLLCFEVGYVLNGLEVDRRNPNIMTYMSYLGLNAVISANHSPRTRKTSGRLLCRIAYIGPPRDTYIESGVQYRKLEVQFKAILYCNTIHQKIWIGL